MMFGSAETLCSKFSDQESAPDTDPSSTFWRVAPKVFFGNDNYGVPLCGFETEVRLRWTMDSLYLLFTCVYDRLNLNPAPQTKTETNGLWNWDVAEVFLGSDLDRIDRYKEFEVSPQGEWVDVDVDLSQPNHEKGWIWDSGCAATARIEADSSTWYAFMRIPFAAIDMQPAAAGNVFRANFYRIQGPDRMLIAWQPTMSPTFHVPAVFGRLVLE